MDVSEKSREASAVEAIARGIFAFLSRTFPLCSFSDEFYYFPQTEIPPDRESSWDDFSPEATAELRQKLFSWERELNLLKQSALDREDEIDFGMLERAIITLGEELSEVRSHQTQPTFYLTIATIGLAAALQVTDPEARDRRIKNLPAFLDQGRRNLSRVPRLFRDLGLEMISDCRKWFADPGKAGAGLQPSLEALNRFENTLLKTPTRDDFRLPAELFERIIRSHLGCEQGVEETLREIEEEIRRMDENLKQATAALLPGRSWPEALASLPLPRLPEEGVLGLYRFETERLAGHCRGLGLTGAESLRTSPVRVVCVPPYLAAVRTASAYSMPPGHPAAGGTFSIIPGEPIRDYRMLTAHETYPGHHLLDACRWNHSRPVRRHLESPIFYEGWACFAEELLARTGYFRGPGDRLLLARRRLWRAMRGRVDLGLQTGEMSLRRAAEYLTRAGMSKKQARATVRRYTLRPGYQVCYTVGLNRFLNLFERFGKDNPAGFARTVLLQGEIGFDDLETIFKSKTMKTRRIRRMDGRMTKSE